ncbi:hypothetical protein B0H66DRAFT_570301 [Apodospora peruviana]|uniref:Uncharacterized protein n=1 Tax=Apodospora peruviana TaxID=516989 RepID=A0AAE0LYE7_9PEZI|nr:hypothetical protein B0H66DRAFT_570301 [Apodospora peruviana]
MRLNAHSFSTLSQHIKLKVDSIFGQRCASGKLERWTRTVTKLQQAPVMDVCFKERYRLPIRLGIRLRAREVPTFLTNMFRQEGDWILRPAGQSTHCCCRRPSPSCCCVRLCALDRLRCRCADLCPCRCSACGWLSSDPCRGRLTAPEFELWIDDEKMLYGSCSLEKRSVVSVVRPPRKVKCASWTGGFTATCRRVRRGMRDESALRFLSVFGHQLAQTRETASVTSQL